MDPKDSPSSWSRRLIHSIISRTTTQGEYSATNRLHINRKEVEFRNTTIHSSVATSPARR